MVISISLTFSLQLTWIMDHLEVKRTTKQVICLKIWITINHLHAWFDFLACQEIWYFPFLEHCTYNWTCMPSSYGNNNFHEHRTFGLWGIMSCYFPDQGAFKGDFVCSTCKQRCRESKPLKLNRTELGGTWFEQIATLGHIWHISSI